MGYFDEIQLMVASKDTSKIHGRYVLHFIHCSSSENSVAMSDTAYSRSVDASFRHLRFCSCANIALIFRLYESMEGDMLISKKPVLMKTDECVISKAL
jgi:hypothetical protein